MLTDQNDLAERFREMSNEELARRCRDHSLTEAAQALAIAELTSRGLERAEPAPSANDPEEYKGDFAMVAQFLNPTDAHVLCSCLIASGIPAVLADANLVQVNALWAIALGGTRLLVPATYVAEALALIDAYDRGDLALPDNDESYRA